MVTLYQRSLLDETLVQIEARTAPNHISWVGFFFVAIILHLFLNYENYRELIFSVVLKSTFFTTFYEFNGLREDALKIYQFFSIEQLSKIVAVKTSSPDADSQSKLRA